MGLTTISLKHFHVAGIRRGAIEDFGAEIVGTAHYRAEWRVFKIGQSGAQFALGKKQVPQPFGTRLGLDLLNDWRRIPAIRKCRVLFAINALVGIDIPVHEIGDPFFQIPRSRALLHEHQTSPSIIDSAR